MYAVSVNIKREMVISPNEEEVASFKEHTQFNSQGTNHTLFSDQKS